MNPSRESVQALHADRLVDFMLMAYLTLLDPSGFTRREIYALFSNVKESYFLEWILPLFKEGLPDLSEIEIVIQRLLDTGLLVLDCGENTQHNVNNHFKISSDVRGWVQSELLASDESSLPTNLATLAIETVAYMFRRGIVQNPAPHMRSTYDYAEMVPYGLRIIPLPDLMLFVDGLYRNGDFEYAERIAQQISDQHADKIPERGNQWVGFSSEGDFVKMYMFLTRCYRHKPNPNYLTINNSYLRALKQAHRDLDSDNTIRRGCEREYNHFLEFLKLKESEASLKTLVSEMEVQILSLRNRLAEGGFEQWACDLG
ncbi:hypothetical protein N7517_000371 [Penicillium concentricum]|uniref:Uncharacterized protein n=1 Tax=Penicillium concentricum TaxID=293559 RepID=A0A9W9SPY0_9EURO|nr:uncharacterized protein N7517_000371 [Penicillium concentricum]KAJ5382460.1 hypothetical protein N7517_000371 [Penicillium concentricum]